MPHISRLIDRLKRLAGVLAIRFDKSPLADLSGLAEFTRTRSAYVAQTSLYGYLKTRMGIRYPTIFQDEAFAPSINRSKVETFTACLSDLTVFAVGLIARDRIADKDETARLACALYELALSRSAEESDIAIDVAGALADFAERCRTVQWASAGIGETAFTASPQALVATAPIVDDLKALDAEIISNSIRFRWKDVRDQLRRRLDPAGVAADWAGLGEDDNETGDEAGSTTSPG